MAFTHRGLTLLALGSCLLLTYVITLSALTIQPQDLPHFQAFDSWDNCFFDGVCYEKSCGNLRGGWYNPTFKDKSGGVPDGVEIRNWWIINSQTPTNWDTNQQISDCAAVRTGPCVDHTLGPATGGRFMYAESSSCYGVTFYVISPTIVFDNTGAELSFYSYMFGASLDNTGSAGASAAILNVEVSIDNGTNWSNVYSTSGQSQTDSVSAWDKVTLDLDGAIGGPASGSNPITTVYRFFAISADDTRRRAYFGDIAIDDVVWTQDGAGPVGPPFIDVNNSRTPVPSTMKGRKRKGGGDGLSTGAIIGIVVGIVGGACILCCLLCLLLLGVLLWVSPRHAPDQVAAAE